MRMRSRDTVGATARMLGALSVAAGLAAQIQPALTSPARPAAPTATALPAAPVDDQVLRTTYELGVDDQIGIWVLESDEFAGKTFRVDREVNLPLVGRMPAAGYTVEKFEDELRLRLSKYIRQPQVVVNVAEFRSQPVSVIGAVTTPGIYQLRGRKNLTEVLSMAGGLRADSGTTVKLTRRVEQGRIPVDTVTEEGGFYVAELQLKTIMEAEAPQRNVQIRTGDVISVPAAKLVYVIGNVERAGGFPLHEKDTLSVLEALSMAGGLSRAASPQSAKILRPLLGGTKRAELPLNVHKILGGKASDVPLLPNDILFIPGSAAKGSAARALDAIIQSGTYLGIARGVR